MLPFRTRTRLLTVNPLTATILIPLQLNGRRSSPPRRYSWIPICRWLTPSSELRWRCERALRRRSQHSKGPSHSIQIFPIGGLQFRLCSLDNLRGQLRSLKLICELTRSIRLSRYSFPDLRGTCWVSI